MGECSAAKTSCLKSVIIPAVPNLVFQIHVKPQTLCVRCPKLEVRSLMFG